MLGMVIAVVATIVLLIHYGTVTTTGWIVLIAGTLIGSAVGLYAAQTMQMTAMPQLVSAFNSVGGGAAALVAIYGYYEAESTAGGVLGTTTVFTRARRAHRFRDVLRVDHRGRQAAGIHPRTADHLQGQPPAQHGARRRGDRHGRVHAHHRQPAGAADRGAGVAGVRGDDGAADRRRGHAGGDLAAERVHRYRGGDGRLRHRELGADRGGRPGGRVRWHPDQADGRRDEPVADQHHRGRVRHRGQRRRHRRADRRPGPLHRGGRRGDPARVRLQGDHRARLRPGRGAGPARRGRAGQDPGRARHRGQLRDPPGGGPDARPHERPAGRGERAVPAAGGDGRHQLGVRPRPTWPWSSARTT